MNRLLLISLTLALLSPACRRSSDQGHDHAGHAHDHGHGHAHVAPHGGTAVVLGDEAYHLEFVQDTLAGTLTGYVLDGHMEKFVRIGAPSFTIEAKVNDRTEVVVMNAVPNTATDETVGDTSQFAAQAEWLRQTNQFEGKIPSLTIRGTLFENIAFRHPEGNEHKH